MQDRHHYRSVPLFPPEHGAGKPAGSNARAADGPGGPAPYRTAIVTAGLDWRPAFSATGTASPAGMPAGTFTATR